MLQTASKIGLAAAMFGLLLLPSAAFGQDRRVRHIQDDAHVFSKEAVNDANGVIDKIHAKYRKDFFIETVAEGPEKDQLTKWARARFDNAKVDGVYLVITKKPSAFRVVVGDHTLREGYFTQRNIEELDKILSDKTHKVNEKLDRSVNYVLETMNAQAPRAKAEVAQPAPPPAVRNAQVAPVHHEVSPFWGSVAGFICIGLVVLVVLWVVFGIIRMIFSSFGGGGGGYGMGGGYGPGYGGGYGGGGGGFLTGMLGGMFGSMAGMWMYNNMFGGHATYGANGGVNWGGGAGAGGAAAAGDDYQGDTGVGATGGGDFGGDDAGGGGGGDDAGAGGGDFGGDDAGGDAGGGDDGGGGGGWFGGGGGGGGDDGGGGGGWFGGGGGDAGGGGGDWGGGGGGDFGGGGGGGGGGDW